MGNPLVSFVEDIVSGVTTVLALIVSVVATIIMGTIVLLAGRFVWRWRARRKKRNQAQNLAP